MRKNKRVTMVKVKEILRLHHQAKLSIRQIAASLNVSHGVVNKYLQRAEAALLQWPLPESMSESELKQLLRPPRTPPTNTMNRPAFTGG